ncbi:hypothetical protein [Echinicola salinicaeni]|uniref:hypothetical protein n=1 Tax=Echinicola salinicaeni TaxID=2762757 RepID=UPI001645BCC9|nr:hypothetical protein [Echinicola salinicaeni]
MNKNFYMEITRKKFFELVKTRREKFILLIRLAIDSFSKGRNLGTGNQGAKAFLRFPVYIQNTGLNFQYINLTRGAFASL